MKNKFTKILSIGLVFAVLASLLVISTPASAGNEVFTLDSSLALIPGKIAAGTEIIDLAATANGQTGYALVSDNTVWKTTDGGNNWSKTGYNGALATAAATKIAVAADSGDFVIVASGTQLWVSQNGGASFLTDAPAAGFGAAISSVSVGPVSGSLHIMAVGAGANTWVFGPDPSSAFGGFGWTNASLATSANVTADPVLAVAVSPNYNTDFTIVMVNSSATSTKLNFYNTAFKKWNADVFLYGTGNLGSEIVAAQSTVADIDLIAGYYAFDTTGATRIAYVALGVNGLYRNTTKISDKNVYSVAVNAGGDKLVAGSANSNVVYSVATPATVTTLTVGTNAVASVKSPGGASNVVVEYFGTMVAAATTGAESGIALSANGSSFNDVALIDTVPAVRDLAINGDASKMYLLTYNVNTTTTSVWRKATSWERVNRVVGDSWIVRPSLDNFDVIFLGQKNTANMFYSNDAGEGWQQKFVLVTTISDIAAETPSIIYVLNPSGTVYKATDGGIFYRAQTVTVGVGGSMNLLSANNVIVAGDSGVAYTSDGGTTWTSPILTLSGAKSATADKLAAGGKIVAITNMAVKTYTIGTSANFADAVATTAFAANSVVTTGGVSYAMTSNTSVSKMYRSPITSAPVWGVIDAAFGFTNIKAAAGKIYALNTSNNGIYVFTEVLAAAGPAAAGPADKFIVAINEATGNANNVVFQWTPVAGTETLAPQYHLQIALDSAFAQVVKNVQNITGTMAIVGATGDAALGFQFPFQADTTYYWRVRVTSPVDSPWSATPRSFKIDTLAPVNIVSPAVGATNVSVTPTFAWSPAPGATGYEIVVSDDPTFAIITFSRTTTQPVFATDDEQLAFGTVYYWRVRPTGATFPAAGTPYKVGVFTTEARPADTTTAPPITITQTTQTITVTVPPPQDVIPPYILWIIIGIGAILVIALIVLIVRTRRVS